MQIRQIYFANFPFSKKGPRGTLNVKDAYYSSSKCALCAAPNVKAFRFRQARRIKRVAWNIYPRGKEQNTLHNTIICFAVEISPALVRAFQIFLHLRYFVCRNWNLRTFTSLRSEKQSHDPIFHQQTLTIICTLSFLLFLYLAKPGEVHSLSFKPELTMNVRSKKLLAADFLLFMFRSELRYVGCSNELVASEAHKRTERLTQTTKKKWEIWEWARSDRASRIATHPLSTSFNPVH